MKISTPHSFHIPVMGLGFTIDTPLKVGRYGINSVVSIIEDNLIEQMREFICHEHQKDYSPILSSDHDSRARRITAYLNLLNEILQEQVTALKAQPFNSRSEIDKYFHMLEDNSFSKFLYNTMLTTPPGNERKALETELRSRVFPGTIDVNIMTKLDRAGTTKSEGLDIFSDALSALRGFAQSTLESSIIFSAGLNPRLFSYCETFDDFYPVNGVPRKKIIIKVSDFRSALIQGKYLAKKGLLVSEFRIESGLNCGGHAFPTEGLLLGPILEEFKSKKEELRSELTTLCNEALNQKGKEKYDLTLPLKITVQGGIGTSLEHRLLMDYYNVDGTGWGSPFLLVPEATSVDDETLTALSNAEPADYYTSYSSPLGVPFNNFRPSSSEKQRLKRIEKNRPGSPCYKKFLSFNTEFTEQPICVASRQYQNLKINQLKSSDLSQETLQLEIEKVMEKDCLCEGLAVAPILKNKILKPKQLKAVAICPGPNLAFFSGIFTLRQMVDHIYGRRNLLNKQFRPNMFLNELKMYCDFLSKELKRMEKTPPNLKYLKTFRENLMSGISYYRNLFPHLLNQIDNSIKALDQFEKELDLAI
jgi:hypothetical protein